MLWLTFYPGQTKSAEWSLHPQFCKLICQVVHSSGRSIVSYEPKLPLYVSSVPDHAWDINALIINWSGLTAYAYPLMALLHRVIQIRQCNCLIIIIAPGWPGMPWFWDLVQLSTEIPLHLPVSTTPQLCVFTAIHNISAPTPSL